MTTVLAKGRKLEADMHVVRMPRDGGGRDYRNDPQSNQHQTVINHQKLGERNETSSYLQTSEGIHPGNTLTSREP